MNIMKKLAAFIVMAALLCPLAYVQALPEAELSEVSEEQLKTAAVLSATGIISDVSEDSFDPGAVVTREEAVNALMRARGLDRAENIGGSYVKSDDLFAESYVEEEGGVNADNAYVRSIFTDIPEDYAYGKNLEMAVKLGYISGYQDNTFRPKEPITYEQLVKMLNCLTGHALYAYRDGYPAGHIKAAAGAGYLKGINLTVGDYVNKAEFHKMLLQAVKADMVRQSVYGGAEEEFSVAKDVNVLNHYLDIWFAKGEVEANAYTSVTGGGTAGIDRVVIGGASLICGETDAADLLGYSVEYYAKQEAGEEEQTLIYIEPYRNGVTEIEIGDVENVSGIGKGDARITYWEESSDIETTIQLEADTVYIYNNVLLPVADQSSFNFENGSITLVDTGDNGSVDVVFINEAEIYVADFISTSTYMLFGKNQAEPVCLDPNDMDVTVRIDGGSMRLGDIKEWDVAEVYVSKAGSGRQRAVVNVVRESVSGTLTALAAQEHVAEIDGAEYKAAPFVELDKLTAGDAGTFYFDSFGRIAGIKKEASASYVYGYMIKCAPKKSGIEERVQLRMAGQYGKAFTLETTDNVYLNNDSSDAETVCAALSERQVLRYKVNEEGYVTHIETAVLNDNQDYDPDHFSRDYHIVNHAYNNFLDRYGEMYTAVGKTVVFIIPGEAAKDVESSYKMGNKSMLVTNQEIYKNVSVYDADENYDIGVLVIETDVAAAGDVILPSEPVNIHKICSPGNKQQR